jgi:hypothetical protein
MWRVLHAACCMLHAACAYCGITSVCSLPAFYFTVGDALAHTPPNGGITSVCSLPAFHFTVGDALAHTPPKGLVGAMDRHAFGSLSASRRSWWAILLEGAGGKAKLPFSYQPAASDVGVMLWLSHGCFGTVLADAERGG